MRHLRPRPIDIHKKLAIIRSEEDVGGNKGAPQNFMELDAKHKPVLSATPPRLGCRTEIKTPSFRVLESSQKEYKPIFTRPSSYFRAYGVRCRAEKNVEYDLDDEDDDWLKQIDIPSRVLDPFAFESMLYKLEELDHRSLEQTGGMPTKRTVGMPVLLQHDDALGAFQVHTNSLSTCDAVYEYWKSKRDHWRKPILRRLHDSLVDTDEQMATTSSLSTSSIFSQSNLREHGHRARGRGPNIGAPDHIKKDVGSTLHPSELSMPAAEAALGDQTDIMSHKRKRKRRLILNCESDSS